MKNSTKKAAIIFFVVSFIISVSGNVVLAKDQNTGSLITAADLAFVKSPLKGSTAQTLSQTVSVDQETGGLITAADLAFIEVNSKGSATQFMRQADSVDPKTGGLITAADLAFIKTYSKASATPDQAFVAEWY